MTTELKHSIEALRAISPKLNKATDQAAALVQAVEKFLTEECSIGVSAWVDVCWRDETDDPTVTEDDRWGRQIWMGYDRCGGRFRIVVRSALIHPDGQCLDGEDDEDKTVPWFEAPRDLKLETFAKLPVLLGAIAEQAAKAVAAAEQSSEAVAQVIEALGVKRK
ncbi:MAG: hypothetical protein NTV86_04565 [Planctomycetota bacterium]|nr:hypothetical protein [Planctomycetota bacterium]